MTTTSRLRSPNGPIISSRDGSAMEFTLTANALSNWLRQSQGSELDTFIIATIRHYDRKARELAGEVPRYSAAYREAPDYVYLETAVASMKSGFGHVAVAFEHEGLAKNAATRSERLSHYENAAEARGEAARALWDAANDLYSILRQRGDADLDEAILGAVRAIDRVARVQYDKKTGHELASRSENGGEWRKIA